MRRALWCAALAALTTGFGVLTACAGAGTTSGAPTPPVFGPIQFQTPTSGEVVDDVFTIEVSGPGMVRAFIDTGLTTILDAIGPGPHVFQIDPLAFNKGDHTFSVRALANSGQFQDFSFTVTVKRPRPPLQEMLDAINNLGPGEWYMVPESPLDDVGFPDDVNDERGPVAGVFSFSGGAYDTTRDRLIVWGGGGNIFRNEIYVFDLATVSWIRINDPSPWPTGGERNAFSLTTHPDGAPVSRHSYDYIEYLPGIDRFYVGGGVAAPSFGDSQVYLFDFDTLAWSNAGEIVQTGFGAVSGVAPDGRVWQHGAGSAASAALAVWDPQTEQSTPGAAWPSTFGLSRTGEIDPVRNRLLAVGGDGVWSWDLDNPGNQAVQLATTGDTEVELLDGPGVAYHPGRDILVAYAGGPNIYTLDLDTLVWTRVALSGLESPGPGGSQGTFGRFRYIPSLDRFIVVNTSSSNVAIYRLPAEDE